MLFYFFQNDKINIIIQFLKYNIRLRKKEKSISKLNTTTTTTTTTTKITSKFNILNYNSNSKRSISIISLNTYIMLIQNIFLLIFLCLHILIEIVNRADF